MSFPCETGCGELAVVRLGKLGRLSVCVSCAEMPQFRRYRVAHLIGGDVTLRRDSAGWWVDDGAFAPPAPLPQVLTALAMPVCPEHHRRPVLRTVELDVTRYAWHCPEPWCGVAGRPSASLEVAAERWRETVEESGHGDPSPW